MAENKVSYGLKNAHYALITETAGVPSYGTPVKLPGAVTLTIDPRGDMAEFYADDMLYYSADNNQGYEGSIEIAEVPESFLKDILAETLDGMDFVLNEISTAQTKKFALLFEFDGDVKATRYVLYNCTASRPSVGSSTRTTSKEPNTRALSFVASPRATDYMVKTKTTGQTPTLVYDAWYTAVYA